MGGQDGEDGRIGKGTALLIIDMVNDLDFPEGDSMVAATTAAARAIARLRTAADAADVPVVYINDNYGFWHAEQSHIIAHCAASPQGAELLALLRPREDDYFVIKPRFSGFYATTLAVLLPRLGASRLILTGIAADICVLFTAADAHMREYELWVPGDCIASFDEQRTRWALEIMGHSMKADTRPTDEAGLGQWLERAPAEAEPA